MKCKTDQVFHPIKCPLLLRGNVPLLRPGGCDFSPRPRLATSLASASPSATGQAAPVPSGGGELRPLRSSPPAGSACFQKTPPCVRLFHLQTCPHRVQEKCRFVRDLSGHPEPSSRRGRVTPTMAHTGRLFPKRSNSTGAGGEGASGSACAFPASLLCYKWPPPPPLASNPPDQASRTIRGRPSQPRFPKSL